MKIILYFHVGLGVGRKSGQRQKEETEAERSLNRSQPAGESQKSMHQAGWATEDCGVPWEDCCLL